MLGPKGKTNTLSIIFASMVKALGVLSLKLLSAGRYYKNVDKGMVVGSGRRRCSGLAGELVNVLRDANQMVPNDLLKFGTHIKKKESKLYGAHFKEISVDAPKSKKITYDDSDEDEM